MGIYRMPAPAFDRIAVSLVTSPPSSIKRSLISQRIYRDLSMKAGDSRIAIISPHVLAAKHKCSLRTVQRAFQRLRIAKLIEPFRDVEQPDLLRQVQRAGKRVIEVVDPVPTSRFVRVFRSVNDSGWPDWKKQAFDCLLSNFKGSDERGRLYGFSINKIQATCGIPARSRPERRKLVRDFYHELLELGLVVEVIPAKSFRPAIVTINESRLNGRPDGDGQDFNAPIRALKPGSSDHLGVDYFI